MVRHEMLVDLLTSRKSLVHTVPESDIVLIHAPAEVDFFAAIKSREIHQTDVQVLYQNADLFNLLESLLEHLPVMIALGTTRFDHAEIDGNPTHHQDALAQLAHVRLRVLKARFSLHRIANEPADARQPPARCFTCAM